MLFYEKKYMLCNHSVRHLLKFKKYIHDINETNNVDDDDDDADADNDDDDDINKSNSNNNNYCNAKRTCACKMQ